MSSRNPEYMDNYDFASMHGRLGNPEWSNPKIVSFSTIPNREDLNTNIDSSEYMDDDKTLDEKANLVIELLQKSKCCTVYTGAGLSRSSGIEDYASKSETSITNYFKTISNPFYASPSYSHNVLVSLEKEGLIHHYIQQNHDGLPQKAGFPQEKINEIHGAWFDPSNPVISFRGKLRTDFYNWMTEMEKKTDLCLCLGTSLSGMNADRIAETPAYKSINNNEILGTVIINLQKTRLDSKCSVRIWARLDDFFKILAKKLKLKVSSSMNINPDVKYNDQFPIPYNANGIYDENSIMIWDLRDGQKIIVTNPDACNFGKSGTIFEKDDQQNYIVHIASKEHRLGKWWIHSVMQGNWKFYLPFVNENPRFLDKNDSI